MIRRPPRSTLSSSSAASDVYKRQLLFPGLTWASSTLRWGSLCLFPVAFSGVSGGICAARRGTEILARDAGSYSLLPSQGPLIKVVRRAETEVIHGNARGLRTRMERVRVSFLPSAGEVVQRVAGRAPRRL